MYVPACDYIAHLKIYTRLLSSSTTSFKYILLLLPFSIPFFNIHLSLSLSIKLTISHSLSLKAKKKKKERKMEQNLPIIAKRLWGIVRVVFFMLRKNISKRKFLLDLNMMLKRGKLASKALVSNLMFHHHHHFTGAGGRHHKQPSNLDFVSGREYEFSCSNTPSYPFSLSSSNKHRRSHINYNFFTCSHAPPTLDDDPTATAHALKAVLDLLNNPNDVVLDPPVASPALPGFGKSPLVRQLRITDSPFPLKSADDGDDDHVDEDAEEFIKKFYRNLKSQRSE